MARSLIFVVIIYAFGFLVAVIAALFASNQREDQGTNNTSTNGSNNGDTSTTNSPSDQSIAPPGLTAKTITLPNGVSFTVFLPTLNSERLSLSFGRPILLRNGSNGNYLTVDGERLALTDDEKIATQWKWNNGALEIAKSSQHDVVAIKAGDGNLDQQLVIQSEDPALWRLQPLERESIPSSNTPFFIVGLPNRRLLSVQQDGEVVLNDQHSPGAVWWME